MTAEPITVRYTNWRGETSDRQITPGAVAWSVSEWHPEPGWVLDCYDHGKEAKRTYRLADCDFTGQTSRIAALRAEVARLTRERDEAHEAAEQSESMANEWEQLHAALVERSRPSPAPSEAVREIAEERRRQVEVEGWTPNHDDTHENGEMSAAAAAYAFSAFTSTSYRAFAADPLGFWPWDELWWKPKGCRRDLVRAGALIVAEIERIDRRDERALASEGERGNA